ncbi:hypothetical protein CYMTET_6514 [Cymbomonas tetramitiformis]|uniref:Sialate O-acetylesterase domain-containing protein n=1 Tax=Cymbomonas tetramitiformis TaxID=36881 RepID=A0AAE0LHZ6_9CHLO|nr:hypothetical protein CYMTET_6514 [Cymbomonas tetramitiformis]|eukprot:gene2878-3680_t
MDNDDEVQAQAAATGYSQVSGCVDVVQYCARHSNFGDRVRELCCATCLPETSLPRANSTEPVQLFLQAGQSECVGHASVNDLIQDYQTYGELVGVQEGVWFAGYATPASAENFFIDKMTAGNGKSTFGPEISMGNRLHEVIGRRVLVVKYCIGGTNTAKNWNPSTIQNNWDRSQDDGTAAWLLENANIDFESKNSLFVNLIYTARRAVEALTAAGVAFQWKAIVWVQGQSDAGISWDVFGANTARVWDAARAAVGVWDLPVVDTGSSSQHKLRSGKAYAGQIVKACNVITVEHAGGTENPNSACTVTPSNPCIGSTDSSFLSTKFFNRYGWPSDPDFPEELRGNSKTLKWFVNFPSNLHSGYEGMVVKGRMLADAYIVHFTQVPLPEAMAAEDTALQFPWLACSPAGAEPTAENLCWMDQRGEALRTQNCESEIPNDELAGPYPSHETKDDSSIASGIVWSCLHIFVMAATVYISGMLLTAVK